MPARDRTGALEEPDAHGCPASLVLPDFPSRAFSTCTAGTGPATPVPASKLSLEVYNLIADRSFLETRRANTLCTDHPGRPGLRAGKNHAGLCPFWSNLDF